MEPFWVRAAWPCDTGRLRAAVTDWDSEGGDAGVRAELVTLVRPQTNTVETPCVLYLQCSTQQPADIVFVEVLSEARTMEVYTEGEYCGTSQGQRVESLQINGDHEQILLFRKYFKLDFPSSSCELKNQAAIGGLFQGIFGARDLIEVGNISSLPQSEEGVTSSNALSKPNPMSVSKLQETKDPGGITTFNAAFTQTGDGSVSPTETNNENKTSDSDESTKDVGEQKFARGDLKGLVSTFLSKQSNGEQNAFSSEMLPLLQDLCGQVNELRMGEKIKVTKNNAAAEDMSCGRHYQQAFCSELEKHIAEHMESVEKRLKDYIDCRINILQTNLDEKFVSLTNLLENIALNRTATKSFERDTILTNGEL
ncbi:ATPase PAAT isoform X3 [Scyliorhinus canicula]|uniref:ATPase PAAT isoform X3 n=1 Tax=Scyliorhinus canicula TaxID=7830 RepID=UPI0018F49163|nr:ATPase PAAT isoform X3 [Scyliorhinus canicula]